jgi:hypothetical protein
MNTSKTLKHFLMLTMVVLLLNGCTSIPSKWLFSSDDKHSEDSSLSENRKSIERPKSQQAIEQARNIATEKRLDALLAEWQAVKSDINRIIELESELGFIVNELTKQDSLNSLHSPNIQLTEYTPQSMPPSAQGELIDNDTDFMAAAEKLNQTPIVGSALPIMNDEQLIDSKFSSLGNSAGDSNKQIVANNSNGKPNSQNNSRQDQSKFSNQVKSQDLFLSDTRASIVGPLPKDDNYKHSNNLKTATVEHQKCESSSQNKQIGIHLISLRDENKVNKAANDLLKKFSTELCATVKVNNVVVKGENYFSVRFGPYLSKQEAQDACTSIRLQGQYCGLTEFVGQLM